MSSDDYVFDVTVRIVYTAPRLRQLRKMTPEAFVKAVGHDLTLIGLMHPRRDNIEPEDNGVRLTWTVTENNRRNVRPKFFSLG
jgi:hypothetical protein